MTDYMVRRAREDDLPTIALNLRAADQKELLAFYGRPYGLGGLRDSLQHSEEAHVADTPDGPFVIWGIRRITPHTALIWALATVHIEKYRVPFIRECRKHLAGWFQTYPDLQHLINFTHGNNTLHHRWLKWCGAELLPPVPYGATGELFRPFVIRRDALV
ncbi:MULTISPECIES: hypothetical protein [unclassified Aminobacter]|uniref:hypothetical protein n=1 Tax=unclassified Aminobacter TaxID=2644704 RepID=UPI0004649F78|nr:MULTISPECIES: hypothetical protein [unclassified Aminobacter]TWH35593.1 hypothetical protein L611_001200000740 [Aminobacter sp. J15]